VNINGTYFLGRVSTQLKTCVETGYGGDRHLKSLIGWQMNGLLMKLSKADLDYMKYKG